MKEIGWLGRVARRMAGTRSAHCGHKGVVHFISDKTMAENFRRVTLIVTNFIRKKWSTGICSGFRQLDKVQGQALINKENPNETSGPISVTIFLFSRRNIYDLYFRTVHVVIFILFKPTHALFLKHIHIHI